MSEATQYIILQEPGCVPEVKRPPPIGRWYVERFLMELRLCRPPGTIYTVCSAGADHLYADGHPEGRAVVKQQPLAEYVHHLSDCPTREIGRGDEGCTCGAPNVIADIELAYGLLWCVLGTDERTHRARMLLAKAIGPDGMKRGLRAVPTDDRPTDRQMIELFLQGDGPTEAPRDGEPT